MFPMYGVGLLNVFRKTTLKWDKNAIHVPSDSFVDFCLFGAIQQNFMVLLFSTILDMPFLSFTWKFILYQIV